MQSDEEPPEYESFQKRRILRILNNGEWKDIHFDDFPELQKDLGVDNLERAVVYMRRTSGTFQGKVFEENSRYEKELQKLQKPYIQCRVGLAKQQERDNAAAKQSGARKETKAEPPSSAPAEEIRPPMINAFNFYQFLPAFNGTEISFYHGCTFDYNKKLFSCKGLEPIFLERKGFRLAGKLSKKNQKRDLAGIVRYADEIGANLVAGGAKGRLQSDYFLFNVADERVLEHIATYMVDQIKKNIGI